MVWHKLTNTQAVDEIKRDTGANLIFKHSTRCSVSMMAKRNFEMEWHIIPLETKCYFLDLIAFREVSNYVAEIFQVTHQSPQILLIQNGQCTLEASHSDISAAEVTEIINA